MEKDLKIKITIGVIVFILFVSIFTGGSPVLDMYTPDDNEQTKVEDDIPAISYNEDMLSEITGGYVGEPKLIKSDDKVAGLEHAKF